MGRDSWALLHQTLAEEFGIYPQITGKLLVVSSREMSLPDMKSETKRTSGETSDGKDQFVYDFNGKLKQNLLKK